MFFVNSDDLTNLDIQNGQCYNQSVPQNLTFSEQGLPLGLSKSSGVNGSAKGAADSLVHGGRAQLLSWLTPVSLGVFFWFAL